MEVKAQLRCAPEYRFYPSNHSVARAAFGHNLACFPYEDSGPDLVGFWSGFEVSNVVLSDVSVTSSLLCIY
jgi:hypothetical protein